MSDINSLLASLDPEILKQLQNINSDDLKKALEDSKPKEEENIEIVEPRMPNSVEDEKESNKPFKSFTEKVKPRIYYETINPDEWEYDNIIHDGWFHSREVYTDSYQLKEASILNISLDEEKMHDDSEGNPEVLEFIEMIYDNALIHLKAKNIIGEFTYKGKERPKFPISFIIAELPFLDVPASKFGLW